MITFRNTYKKTWTQILKSVDHDKICYFIYEFSYIPNFLKIYLFLWKSRYIKRSRDRDKDLLSADSLPKWPQWSKWFGPDRCQDSGTPFGLHTRSGWPSTWNILLPTHSPHSQVHEQVTQSEVEQPILKSAHLVAWACGPWWGWPELSLIYYYDMHR